MEYSVSNIEFTLLQLIAQFDSLSGYDLDNLVQERGYRQWAGIGTTSIYNGLEKLKGKGLIQGALDTAKQGRGPLPRKFRLTKDGQALLHNIVLTSLAHADGKRFSLALGSLPAVSIQQAAEAVAQRVHRLEGEYNRVQAKYTADGGDSLPLNVRALFYHSLLGIKTELEFSQALLDELTEDDEYGKDRY